MEPVGQIIESVCSDKRMEQGSVMVCTQLSHARTCIQSLVKESMAWKVPVVVRGGIERVETIRKGDGGRVGDGLCGNRAEGDKRESYVDLLDS
jgi:hypothetical protein